MTTRKFDTISPLSVVLLCLVLVEEGGVTKSRKITCCLAWWLVGPVRCSGNATDVFIHSQPQFFRRTYEMENKLLVSIIWTLPQMSNPSSSTIAKSIRSTYYIHPYMQTSYKSLVVSVCKQLSSSNVTVWHARFNFKISDVVLLSPWQLPSEGVGWRPCAVVDGGGGGGSGFLVSNVWIF